MAEYDFNAALLQVEQHYDLGSGFLSDLLSEDDWSFVIKSHALLEAAVSQLLTHHIGDQRLASIVERLELSNMQVGRLAFVRALDLLDKPHHRFIRSLSELRNDLVHDVHSTRFHFSDHLAAMDKNQISAFWKWTMFFMAPDEGSSLRHTTNAKPIIWFGTVLVVIDCVNRTNEAKYRHAEIDRALEILSDFDAIEDDDQRAGEGDEDQPAADV